MKIGFIGLGNMGGPMAANLAKAGHEVAGFDVTGVSVPGVTSAASASEAATDKDAVITMLPDGPIVRAVYAEITPAAKPGTLLIDCSTVDVASARALHEMAREHGYLSLDAPVSGGVAGAEGATLTFMVGGREDAFAGGKPLFEVMGKRAVHCGEGGAGQAAKICNNMILGISMIGVCEAFHLADKLGLSRQAMFDVVTTSSGNCWSIGTYCPAPGIGPKSPADNDYKPGFAAELMLKDLTLSQKAAETAGARTRMGEHARQIYEAFVADGGKGKDFSAILKALGEATS